MWMRQDDLNVVKYLQHVGVSYVQIDAKYIFLKRIDSKSISQAVN